MVCLEERNQVLRAARGIASAGLVIGTWGNVSVRASHYPWVVITPSGMEYSSMTVEDMVVVDNNSQVMQGSRLPSVETLLHLEIYRQRSDVGAIVHVHSPYAAAFAVAGRSIPVILEETAQVIGHEVSVAPYARCGTRELAGQAAQCLGNTNKAVLLANHGLVALGDNISNALKVCYIVEKTARVALYAHLLGRVNVLGPDETSILSEEFKSYGQVKKSPPDNTPIPG